MSSSSSSSSSSTRPARCLRSKRRCQCLQGRSRRRLSTSTCWLQPDDDSFQLCCSLNQVEEKKKEIKHNLSYRLQKKQLDFSSDLEYWSIFLFLFNHSPHYFYATPFIYILSTLLPTISLSSMPFSGAQREPTALRVVARPHTTTSRPNPLISFVHCRLCPSVSMFALLYTGRPWTPLPQFFPSLHMRLVRDCWGETAKTQWIVTWKFWVMGLVKSHSMMLKVKR